MQPSIGRFVDLLHRSIGLDAESIGSNSIERAVLDRFAAWRQGGEPLATLDDYWRAVTTVPARMQDLIEAVVVPETWFFRDAEAFSALVRMTKARLAAHPSKPVRVLSLPCSSGEEAYSVAMALLDANLAPAQFSVDALDVSERALARARHAHYGRNAFRGHALAFRDRHFHKAKEGWRLDPLVSGRVRFAQANLLKLSPLAYEPFDFIFCRNVLIYFDRDTQRAALHVLDGLLASGGTLFVGPAETGLLMREGMASAKIPLAFAFQRAAPAQPDDTVLPTPASPHPAVSPRVAARAPVSPAAMPFAAYMPAPASRGRPHTVPHAGRHAVKPRTAPSLARARSLADAGDLVAAADAARDFLGANPSSAEAYYLLGVIADARDEPSEARMHYKRALYLDPAHREALTHLAALLELDGDEAGARLLLARAERVTQAARSKGGDDE